MQRSISLLMVTKLSTCFRLAFKNNILTCLSYVAGIGCSLWLRDFLIWLKHIVRKEVISLSAEWICSCSWRIWKWLAYHKHYSAKTISFVSPHECYMFLKTSSTKSNRVTADFLIFFFLSALPSFRHCYISSIFLFAKIESHGERGRVPSLFSQTNADLIPPMNALSLSLSRVLDHAAGLISEEHVSGVGDNEPWNLAPCLWKLKTRREWFLFCFLFWEIFSGRSLNANYTQWTYSC